MHIIDFVFSLQRWNHLCDLSEKKWCFTNVGCDCLIKLFTHEWEKSLKSENFPLYFHPGNSFWKNVAILLDRLFPVLLIFFPKIGTNNFFNLLTTKWMFLNIGLLLLFPSRFKIKPKFFRLRRIPITDVLLFRLFLRIFCDYVD